MTSPTASEPLTDIEALQQRVAELEQALARERETTALQRRLVAIFDVTPDFIGTATLQGRVLYLNPAARRMAGLSLDADVTELHIADFHPPDEAHRILSHAMTLLLQEGMFQHQTILSTRDGRQIPVWQILLPHFGSDGTLEFLSTIMRDLTEQLRIEAIRNESLAHEQTIRAQEAILEQLSTPLIPITDHVMVMPLIGGVDTRRASRVLDTLLPGLSGSQAKVVILDITGVPVVDSDVANALLQAARAVRLLGAQVVLTGIRPRVAQTLVELGIDLQELNTRSTLQQGIAFALRLR